jgi:hypothetical protein
MRICKPNRNGGPVRVTQRGTATAYPQPNWKRLAKKRDRYADTSVRHPRRYDDE